MDLSDHKTQPNNVHSIVPNLQDLIIMIKKFHLSCLVLCSREVLMECYLDNKKPGPIIQYYLQL